MEALLLLVDCCKDGAIPAITRVMGGNLLKGLKGSGIQKSIIFCILIVCSQFHLPHIGTSKLMLEQLFGGGENECSVIMLLWSVLLAGFLTLWSTFFLWLVPQI